MTERRRGGVDQKSNCLKISFSYILHKIALHNYEQFNVLPIFKISQINLPSPPRLPFLMRLTKTPFVSHYTLNTHYFCHSHTTLIPLSLFTYNTYIVLACFVQYTYSPLSTYTTHLFLLPYSDTTIVPLLLFNHISITYLV